MLLETKRETALKVSNVPCVVKDSLPTEAIEHQMHVFVSVQVLHDVYAGFFSRIFCRYATSGFQLIFSERLTWRSIDGLCPASSVKARGQSFFASYNSCLTH